MRAQNTIFNWKLYGFSHLARCCAPISLQIQGLSLVAFSRLHVTRRCDVGEKEQAEALCNAFSRLHVTRRCDRFAACTRATISRPLRGGFPQCHMSQKIGWTAYLSAIGVWPLFNL